MAPHRRDDREQVRAAVGARYAGLALMLNALEVDLDESARLPTLRAQP